MDKVWEVGDLVRVDPEDLENQSWNGRFDTNTYKVVAVWIFSEGSGTVQLQYLNEEVLAFDGSWLDFRRFKSAVQEPAKREPLPDPLTARLQAIIEEWDESQ